MGSPIVHLEIWTPGFIQREINVVWIAATRWIFNICIRLAVWGVFDKADIGLISRKASDESAPNCRFGANIFWCGGNWSTRIPNIFLQTTFLQVSRVRRGATQRDYRLLYYKFFRFPENPEPRHFSSRFSSRCARQGVYTIQRLQRLQAVRQTTTYYTTSLADSRKIQSHGIFPQNFLRAARGREHTLYNT